jgi:SAM-dependent methyltransferase
VRKRDISAHNQRAWDRKVDEGCRWSIPVGARAIADARAGRVEIVLTPVRIVPEGWLQPLRGRRVLALASGGGQQGPLLAAAGADVTVFDASPAMLARDREVADREHLALETVQGDMCDLSAFEAESFDLIVHPTSNCFCPELEPVWREATRVLRTGGELIAGFINPAVLCMDPERAKQGELIHRYVEPYSDLTSITAEERERFISRNEPLVFGHSLEDQIGGQLRAGLVLVDFYSDGYGETDNPETATYDRFLPSFFATRARKS